MFIFAFHSGGPVVGGNTDTQLRQGMGERDPHVIEQPACAAH